MKEKKETREMVAGYMDGSRKGIGKGGLMQSNRNRKGGFNAIQLSFYTI